MRSFGKVFVCLLGAALLAVFAVFYGFVRKKEAFRG